MEQASPIGSAFDADTGTGQDVAGPAVADLTASQFVVVTSDYGSTGADSQAQYNVFGQVFDASSGTPVPTGGRFQVNTTAGASTQSVTALSATRFAVAWIDANGVEVQAFDTSMGGTPVRLGPQLQVSNQPIYFFDPPRIAALSSSRFVVDYSLSGTVDSQVVDISTGVPTKLGSATATPGTVDNPSIVALSASRYVIGYSDVSPPDERTPPPTDFHLQIYDTSSGTPTAVGSTTITGGGDGTVFALSPDRFLVETNGQGQLYDSAADTPTPVGTPFALNGQVTPLTSSTFLVTQPGTQGQIYSFGATTAGPIGDPFSVSSSTGNQANAVSAALSSNEFVSVANDLSSTTVNQIDGTSGQLFGITNRQIFGTDGNDTLTGADQSDSIYGEGGNDTISGGGGGDNALFGDAGDDTLITTQGVRTEIFGGTGNDRAIVGGNVFDYTLERAPVYNPETQAYDPALELVADNGTGTITIDSDVETVQFQNGQSLSYGDVGSYVPVVNGGGSSGDDTLLAPVSGNAFLDGEGGSDRAVLNGNVSDYTLSRFSSVDLASTNPEQGAFVLTSRNGSGVITISESTETVQFQDGQYLSLEDLPAYVAGDATYTTGSANNDILIATYSGNQTLTGGGGTDAAYVHGNVTDYTLRPDTGPTGGYTLVPLNASGTIDVAGDVASVHFQDGQYLALKDLSAYIPAQVVSTGTTASAVLTAPVGGDAFLDGQGGGTAVVNGNVGDYTLNRLQTAPTGDPADEQGAFVLESRNGSGNIAVSQSTGGVQFQNGQFLSLKDLSAYVASSGTDNPSYTVGGAQNDILTVPTGGDQYLVGNGGTDAAFLHGNTSDYTLLAVNQPAAGSRPAIDGYELKADNNSGNLYIDQSTESIHFANGQYLAFKDLASYIPPSSNG